MRERCVSLAAIRTSLPQVHIGHDALSIVTDKKKKKKKDCRRSSWESRLRYADNYTAMHHYHDVAIDWWETTLSYVQVSIY